MPADFTTNPAFILDYFPAQKSIFSSAKIEFLTSPSPLKLLDNLPLSRRYPTINPQRISKIMNESHHDTLPVQLTLTMLGAFAEFERAKIMERMMRGKLQVSVYAVIAPFIRQRTIPTSISVGIFSPISFHTPNSHRLRDYGWSQAWSTMGA